MANPASRNRWAIGVAIAAIGLLGATMFRFEAIANPRGFIFMQDRLFGQHRICYLSEGELKCEGLAKEPGKAGMFDDLIPKP